MGAFDLEVSEAELVAMRRGERSAQAAIYRRFERPCYSLARRMLDDPDAASDALQEAFLTAFRSVHQYRGEAPFGHWLRRVVATQALMQLRARRRWHDIFVPMAEDCDTTFGAEDLPSLDLEALLARLPPLPRAVLWLYHVEGYTHQEIAALCGRTVSFSKSQLSRAHAKLREQLNAVPTANGVCDVTPA